MVEVTLSEFAIPTLQSFSGGLDEFVLKRLQHASNSALVQLAEHLGYSKAKIVAPHDGAGIWDQGQLRVFHPICQNTRLDSKSSEVSFEVRHFCVRSAQLLARLFGLLQRSATQMDDIQAIAMHSVVYREALLQAMMEFIPQSQGLPIETYRGMAVIVDDGLQITGTATTPFFTTVLLGYGAVGYAASAPRAVAPRLGRNRGKHCAYKRS